MLRRVLIHGLLAAAGVAAWTMIEFTLGWHDSRADIGRYTGFIGLLAPIAAISLALLAARRARGGTLGLREGMAEGSAITAIFAVVAALFYWVYYTRINPGYNDGGTPVDPIATAKGVFGGSIAAGLLITAVATVVLRRRQPHPDAV